METIDNIVIVILPHVSIYVIINIYVTIYVTILANYHIHCAVTGVYIDGF